MDTHGGRPYHSHRIYRTGHAHTALNGRGNTLANNHDLSRFIAQGISRGINFKLFHRGTPENKIVEERIVDLDTQFRAKHITMDDLSEKTAQERIEFSRSKANEGAKWEGDMPALKALKLWVDGKEEAAAGTQ